MANKRKSTNRKPVLTASPDIDGTSLLGLDLRIIIYLYNMRTRAIGFNQVQTTYMRHVDEDLMSRLAISAEGHSKANYMRYMQEVERWARSVYQRELRVGEQLPVLYAGEVEEELEEDGEL